MIDRARWLAARWLAARWLAAIALGGFAAGAGAADDSFTVSDAEFGRLGVTLEVPESVERVEVAAAPAEVVVPPRSQALVSAPQSGVVARLLVAEGDAVAAAQPLAEIDSAEYLDRQRDYLDAAAEAELAAAQEARDRGLFGEGIIAERRLLETAAAARAARSRLEQAGAQLALAGLTRTDLERLAADRRLATRIVLRAPFAGTVTAVHAALGGRVDALDPVIGVADLRELWLEVRLPQEAAAVVTTGMTLAVNPPGGGDVTGFVTMVGAVVDSATQTVLVRAAVDNGRGALRAGQFLTTRISSPPAGGVALAIPSVAVTRSGGETLVFVRSGGDVLVRRVAVVADDGARAYVGGGLDPGARVAVDGVSALKAMWLASLEEGG